MEEKNNETEHETELLEDANADQKFLTEEHDGELIANLTEKIEGLEDKLLRTIAESENLRMRMNKTIEETRDYSIVGFAKDLVPVIDHLAMALSHLPENMTEEIKIIVEGLNMTKKELESVFKKHGLEAISPIAGENFDYNHHHAISQVMTDKHKEGTIVDTMQVGYKIKDRLIRPASVAVAKKG
jgi:molecular chaperone GrpE